MKGGYKLLLFDFDGTLVDTVGDIAYYANSVLADHGAKPSSLEQVKSAIGFGVHELLKALEPALGRDAAVLDGAVEIFKRRYRENPVRETKPFPGVVDMLSGPLSSVTKAIITNKPQDITLQILDRLKMTAHFELVIGMNAGYPPKPDPASMRYAMEKLGALSGDTVYIGDSRVDAETSVNAGVDFGWVRYGYDILDGEKRAYEFDSAPEWSRLISR